MKVTTKKHPILYDENKVKFGQVKSEADILILMKEIFHRTFEKKWIEWLNNSPNGANKWYGAFEDDDPIALYGLLPIKVKVGSEHYNGALCNNVGVVPRFQGKGLFQAIGEYALNDRKPPLVIGVPNTKAVKGHKRIGWRSYGLLELLSGEVGQKEVSKVGYEHFRYLPPKKESYFRMIRDQAYIKWRYAKPGIEYYQSFYSDDNYIIWKTYEGKKQVLETNNYNHIFELGGVIDIWQFANSESANKLKEKGFKSILSNDFILFTDLDFDNDINKYCFELGDNDVF